MSQSAERTVAQDVRSPADVLLDRLRSRTDEDDAYWNFARNHKRSHGHALFPYPAMMVPQLQGALLDDLVAADPAIAECYDPFAGSGTVLTECMRRGLDFIGTDLNPLAVLIMAVKARPLRERTLRDAVTEVLRTATRSPRSRVVKFVGRDKWFEPDVVQSLQRLRAAIQAQPGQPTRRFLWVCMAATIRLVSNSRKSTFKLHAYPAEVIGARSIDTLEVFRGVADEAVAQIGEQYEELHQRGRVVRGSYTGNIRVRHADVLARTEWDKHARADLLMTSPPYGDNRTTVPYGQHSYLPLMWIDRADLPAGQLEALLGSPYRIDVASVGGRRVTDPTTRLAELSSRSPAIAATAGQLESLSGNGLVRFLAFCSDLDKAIDVVSQRLRPGAFQLWTLGNRRISGLVAPTSTIVCELACSRGARELTTIHRQFPSNSRRMASRNDTVPLMSTEQILVMQSAQHPQPHP